MTRLISTLQCGHASNLGRSIARVRSGFTDAETLSKWPDGFDISIAVNLIGIPVAVDPQTVINALANAAKLWKAQTPGLSLRWANAGETPSIMLVWSNQLDSNTLGLTDLPNPNAPRQCLLRLNSQLDWVAIEPNELADCILHEFGHAIGMDHTL